jgi:hypothetical protein
VQIPPHPLASPQTLPAHWGVQHSSFWSQTWSALEQQPLPVQITPLTHAHVPSLQMSPG